MIERYTITSPADTLRERFNIDVPDFYKPNFNASPTQLLPVITLNSQGISLFYWGEIPGWAKNKTPGEKIINVRVESLDEKPALKKSMIKNRCVIPADGFYAWKKVGKKTIIPYRFVRPDKNLFSFPGLWEEFEDEDGSEMHTFSIFTTGANEMISPIQERMPVIFDKASEQVWLNPATTENEMINLLVTDRAIKMDYYPVSPRINDIKVDVPSLILPSLPADQHGNLTLFD